MARNSLRVMPGRMPRIVARGAAVDQASAPGGAHFFTAFSHFLRPPQLAVKCGFELARLALRRGEPGVTDEAGELRVGARERTQQAQMNRMLQFRIPLVVRKKLARWQFQQPSGLAHPRGRDMRRALEDREVADQLA